MNKLYALSLMVVMAGSFAACNKAERTNVSVDRNAADQQELASGQSEVRGEVGTPEDLKEGQPLDYYLSEFKRMGYDVSNVDHQGDQWMYNLRKPNAEDRYVVTLDKPASDTNITKVDVEHQNRVDVANNDEANAIVKKIEAWPTGKMPSEYFTELQKIGTVTEYKHGVNKKDAEAEVAVMQGNKEIKYEIKMKVDPQTDKVSAIDAHEDIWSRI